MQRLRPKTRFLGYVLMGAACLIAVVPLAYMVVTSLLSNYAIFDYPPALIPRPPHFRNYPDAFAFEPFGRMYLNSVLVTLAIIAVQLVTSITGAYAFAFTTFRAKNAVFLVYLASMMVPMQVIFIPLYLMVAKVGMINSYEALIVPYATSAFGVFLLRQSFLRTPKEVIDAARVDGTRHLGIMARVVVPLNVSPIVALVAVNFVAHFNDFFWPFVVTTTTSMRTLPVGLAYLITTTEGSNGVPWNLAMAATVFSALPPLLVFVLSQRHFVQGVSTTGLNG